MRPTGLDKAQHNSRLDVLDLHSAVRESKTSLDSKYFLIYVTLHYFARKKKQAKQHEWASEAKSTYHKFSLHRSEDNPSNPNSTSRPLRQPHRPAPKSFSGGPNDDPCGTPARRD